MRLHRTATVPARRPDAEVLGRRSTSSWTGTSCSWRSGGRRTDDWTTLPDANGHTTQNTGQSLLGRRRAGATLHARRCALPDAGGATPARRPARPASGTRPPAPPAAGRSGTSTCPRTPARRSRSRSTTRPTGRSRASASGSTTRGLGRRRDHGDDVVRGATASATGRSARRRLPGTAKLANGWHAHPEVPSSARRAASWTGPDDYDVRTRDTVYAGFERHLRTRRPARRSWRRCSSTSGVLEAPRSAGASATGRLRTARRRPGLPSKVGSPTVHFHEHPGRRRPQARLRRLAAALHLHGGARPPARVDPRLRDQGARAARRGVGGDDVPGLRLRAHGRAGAARALLSRRSTAARAATTTATSCWPRRWSTATPAASRWASRCTPTWRRRRSTCSAPRSRSSATSCPSIAGSKISCLGITEPDAGSDVAGHPHARGARRRRVGDQRLQDLHHQRPSRRLHRARRQDRPGRRARRHQPLHRRHGPARRRARASGCRSSACTPPTPRCSSFQDVRVPAGRAARRGGQGLLPHHVGAPGRAA